MAAGTGKHKLLSAGPTEPWSIREKLCLASSVMRSGDQNWVSVSRAIKPFAEPGRPPDWFSQKHCASQYSELLETTETPKRKRGEKGEVVETVEDVIVRKLTAERVEELKKIIKETQEKYRQLKKDAELIQAGHMDNRLEELCNEIMIKKKMEEEEAEVKRKATDAAYQARQAIKNPPRRLTGVMVRSPAGSTSPGGEYALGDLSQPAGDEASPGVTPGTLPSTPVASFIGIPDTPPGSAPLDAPMTPVTDDSPQKKMLGQKATPPPSPLLSELLKKGSLLPTSPRLVGENEMAVASGHMNSSGVLLEVGSVLPVLHSGEMQSTPGAVPASPAASGAPTLSRLLEAGPAQFTSPLASFSAVASEPPAKLLPPPVEPVSQATIVMMPTLSAPSVVPPAAAPESVATVSQPEACVSMEAVSDSHTVTVSMDSSEISMIIDSIKKECLGSGAGSTAGSSKDHCMDGKEDLDLAEKMDIAVSYTGEELDFDTVGNIIAIIEDKVDDHPEVLDAAVVEAALSSFCEDTDDPQTLPGPWEHSIRQEHEKQAQIPQVSVTVKQERLECEEPEAKGIRDLMGIGELASEIKTELAEQEQSQLGPEETIPATARVTETSELRSQEIEEDQRAGLTSGETPEINIESSKGEDAVLNSVKTETPPDDDSSPPQVPNVSEDSSQADVQHKFELSESMKEEAQALFRSQMKDGQGEEDDEDGASEAASLEEPKEEDQGEGYLSEMDNEPPVSESDDGFSVHNAPLQSHALADSIPSSPASSQFSVCSEDQEAIQAQKIWKKAIMLVWRAAANHRYANVFLQPVTDDIAPGYHSIVQRPMDLSTIKKNIENGLIRTTAEFQRDIMLMFQNAVMYNSSDHDVYHMAVEMQRDVLEQIQQFLATQLMMQTSESGISAKSLRGRDSTRKQDASEKMGQSWESQNSGFQPLPDWDSSLDLDMRSWRNTEDMAVGKVEESTQEADCELRLSEPLWEDDSEDYQETEKPYESNNLLQFLFEVTQMLESLCTDSTESSQTQWDYCGLGKQSDGEDVRCQEKTTGTAVLGAERSQLHILAEDEKEHLLGRGDKTPESPGEQALGEQDAQEMSAQAQDQDDSGSTSAAPVLDSTSPPNTHLVQPSWNNPLQHSLLKKTLLTIWRMIASHRYSSPFLKPVSEKQAPGYRDVVKRPMDLTTIKRRLAKGHIQSMIEFQRDLMLMFQNAVMYNSSDHHVFHIAVEMQREVMEQLQVLGEALLYSRDRLE
ncbi:bromodomain-containing protein 8 isoform X3 [Neopelma chrysocephalum]|uniref:bromodomain-containing protein 8 isoform X3 n=1 Tax=Neopelma chrysocephalum TaxID=114329 RepID=UPI000FCCF563|nr:bromodomain-containing protein 8 isoform X3 [Neopelma chrysocephalum]